MPAANRNEAENGVLGSQPRRTLNEKQVLEVIPVGALRHGSQND